MGFIPAAIAIGEAGLSAFGASERNRGIQRSMDAANAATAEELRQIEAQRKLERQKRIRDAEKVRGIVAVNAAERGVGFGGSVTALDRQALYDEGTNVGTVDTNAGNAARRSLSQLSATNTSLANQSINVLASIIQGGLQGASTGLSIERAFAGPTPAAGITQPPNDASIIMPGYEQRSAYA